jgi:indole-3-glycerol phosphate synthase
MAATILNTIADYARLRVAEDKKIVSAEEMEARALAMPKGEGRFLKALQKPEMAFICEVKKASPSKGLIDPVFDYMTIADNYQAAGADCVSCLTEPKWFLGSDDIFRAIRQRIQLPMIRKDFTVDSYQIYQAKCMGADAVLLICALMDRVELKNDLTICDKLGLDALVETHDESEIAMAIETGAKIIGVNNRNLKDFSVDFENAARLRHLIPKDVVYVAESGVKDENDVAALRKIGADAVLMGEVLMRAKDQKAFLLNCRRREQ